MHDGELYFETYTPTSTTKGISNITRNFTTSFRTLGCVPVVFPVRGQKCTHLYSQIIIALVGAPVCVITVGEKSIKKVKQWKAALINKLNK